MELKDKVVVVLGAKGLLGQDIARACSQAGAKVVAVDIEECDATDEAQVIALAQKVKEQFGHIDGVVNATYPRTKNYGQKFEEGDLDEKLQNTSLHLKICFTAVRAFAPIFKSQKGGVFVFMSSIYGVAAPKFDIYEGTDMVVPPEYAAAKGGIDALVRYFAALFGKDGIRVNSVAPGGLLGNQPDTFIKKYSQHVHLGDGLLEPKDISGVVTFLLSDVSAKMTGQTLVVDAGWTL